MKTYEIKNAIKRIIPKSQFVQSVIVLAGGSALGQGLALLVSPILTRLYTSSDFGVLAVFSSILGVLSVIATLRYEEAISLPKEDSEALNLLILSVGVLLIMAFVSSIFVLFIGDRFISVLNVIELKPYLWLFPFSLVGIGLYQILSYWAVRKADFLVISKTKVSQNLSQVFTQIIIGVLKKGPLGLVIGDLIGRMAGSGMFLRSFIRKDFINIHKSVSFASLKTSARIFWKFPAYNLPNGLLNTISQQIPNFLFASLFNSATAGYYFIAIRVTSAPLSLIGKSVAQVFLQKAAVKYSKGDDLLNLVNNVHKHLLLIIIIPSLILLFFSPVIFQFVFGEEWKQAGEYLQLLMPWIAAMFVLSPTTWIFSIVNKQETMLSFEIVLLISRTISILAGAKISRDPILAVGLFGLVGFVANLFLWRFLLNACKIKEEDNIS